MLRNRRRFLVGLWAAALLLACSAGARAQAASMVDTVDDPEAGLIIRHQNTLAERLRQLRESRGVARPQIYEAQDKTGGLHTAGRVWAHVDNTNYGNPGNVWAPIGLNQDPAAQWAGNSGNEYIYWSNLWVAGKDKQGIRRASEYDEIRGELADFARTRHAYEGIPGGRRGYDDDGDRKVDEDFLNGKDDDGDGQIDEDFAAISPDMFSTEMLDYTPEAISDVYPEPHVPLGLRIQRRSFAWSTPGGNDFIGVHFEITNMTREIDGTGHNIDSVYVAMYWREQTGALTNPNRNGDDLVGMMEMGVDGTTKPSDILNNPDRSSHEDSILHIFWSADNDGDNDPDAGPGVTPIDGAGAFVLLNATRFPRLGFKANLTSDDTRNDEYGNAPRHLSVHTYRFFRAGVPYEQGGRPTTDLQIYDALSNETKKQVNFPPLSATGIYRTTFSVGPYATLPIDSTIEFDVAFAVGKANYNLDARFPTKLTDIDFFNSKFGTNVPLSLLASVQEAWQACYGTWLPNLSPGIPESHPCGQPGDQENPGDSGRETCFIMPLGKHGFYRDCRDRPGNLRAIGDQRCTWFDMDCDSTTGICDASGAPLVDHERWVGQSPPVPPKVEIVRGKDRQVEIKWNDISEKIPDPGTGVLDFRGYRLYRASGWKRDPATGLNGPANDLWQLVKDWSLAEPTGPPANALLSDARDPSVSETSYDSSLVCPGPGCKVHKVGYYHYVDKDVNNGFRYFYVVTAYDRTTKSAQFQVSPIDTTESQETGRSATGDQVAVPQTSCSPDVDHIKVVPNPYRYKAAWNLRPSAADPTGSHLNFNHLPCGTFTLKVFTAAGDLVRTFDQTDARGTGTVEWDLVTRNGQDIKSGIYLYSVESTHGHTVGRFTVIR